jgi:hypothetical protein
MSVAPLEGFTVIVGGGGVIVVSRRLLQLLLVVHVAFRVAQLGPVPRVHLLIRECPSEGRTTAVQQRQRRTKTSS